MLLEMKAGTEAMRALTLYAAWQLDLAEVARGSRGAGAGPGAR